MRAVRLYEYGKAGNLKYEEDVPDPEIGPDEILVAAAATSINPIDWKMRSGEAKERFPVSFPAILGRDVSGIVRAVGADVQGVRVGDRVMALTHATYADLVKVKGSEASLIPEGLAVADAAAVPLVVLTGNQLIHDACGLQPQQSVLVTGALGSVGRSAVHSAKKLGATVIAGVRKRQLEQAKGLGVPAVAIDDEDALKELGKVDAIADTTGPKATNPLLSHLRDGGVCGTVVTPTPDGSLHPQITVKRIMSRPDAATVREFAEDLHDGKFVLPVARTFSLRDAAEAQSFAEKGGAEGKVLLLMV